MMIMINHQQEIEFENHNNNSIYYFNQDKSPFKFTICNNNTNGDIDYYYTRVHQTCNEWINDHDTVRSTNSSDQSIGLIPTIDQTSNYLQVKFLILINLFLFENICRLEQHVVEQSNNKKICWTRW